MTEVIAKLARALVQNEDRHAVLRQFVADNQFPLLDDTTATFFFYDAERRADGVSLIHWVQGLESRQAFQSLGWGAFVLTLELPARSRVEYKFMVHRAGRDELVRDPLNDLRAFDPFGSNSVLATIGYEQPEWVNPEVGVRTGRLESFKITSLVWGGEREIRVYVPHEYRPRNRYPLLVCHDGDDYLNYAAMQTVLDNTIHRNEVAPILVAFTSGGAERNKSYGANSLQARFLVEEVIPAVQERYRVSEDPEDHGLMGASFGAVSSLHCAWLYPGHFGRLMLQSGSFLATEVGHHGRGPVWDPVVNWVNTFREDPSCVSGMRIYQSCGTFEGLIHYNRGMSLVLRRAGADLRTVEARDGHNWIAWRDRLREGLAWLYPGHLWMTYD